MIAKIILILPDSLSDFPGFEAAQNLQYLSTARKVFANDRVYGEWEVVEHSSEKPSQGDILDLSQIKQELQTIENDDEGADFQIRKNIQDLNFYFLTISDKKKLLKLILVSKRNILKKSRKKIHQFRKKTKK